MKLPRDKVSIVALILSTRDPAPSVVPAGRAAGLYQANLWLDAFGSAQPEGQKLDLPKVDWVTVDDVDRSSAFSG
jgi:hypothetical protein